MSDPQIKNDAKWGVVATRAHFATEFIDKGTENLTQPNLGPLERWNLFVAHCFEAHVAYITILNVDTLLVHPKNRGGLGLNAFNVHKNGVVIVTIGCDADALRKSVCWEMPVDPASRSKVIKFNEKLIELSNGLLAKLNHSERYQTTSTSHTTAFCRAVKAGCKTPEKKLADDTGCIDTARLLGSKPVLANMTSVGWEWTCMPWQVEETWPYLPDLAQSALNAGNNVPTTTSELEAACTIYENAHMSPDRDWEAAVAACIESQPPCKEYASILGAFARGYAGSDCAMLKFLNNFGNEYGANKTLGQEFWKHVTETKVSDLEPVPFARAAFVATQLIADKVVDGIARLLQPNDFRSQATSSNKRRLIELDNDIEHAWSVIQSLPEAQAASVGILGRFMAGKVLLLTGKTKLIFKDSAEITDEELKATFIKEIRNLPVKFTIKSHWVALAGKPAKNQASRPSAKGKAVVSAKEDPLADLHGQTDIMAIIAAKGFKPGIVVEELGFASTSYAIESLSNSGCQIRELDSWTNDGYGKESFVLELTMLLAKWKVTGKCVHSRRIDPNDVSVNIIDFAKDEFVMQKVYNAMYKETVANSANWYKVLEYGVKPKELRAKEDIKKGQLVLSPMTTPGRLSRTSSPSPPIVHDNVKYYPVGPKEPAKEPSPSDGPGKASIIPYFWVGTTSDEKKVTVVLKTKVNNEVTIPVFTNVRTITAGEPIVIFKAATQAKALKGAVPASKAMAELPKAGLPTAGLPKAGLPKAGLPAPTLGAPPPVAEKPPLAAPSPEPPRPGKPAKRTARGSKRAKSSAAKAVVRKRPASRLWGKPMKAKRLE